jgi:hypothetical protein
MEPSVSPAAAAGGPPAPPAPAPHLPPPPARPTVTATGQRRGVRAGAVGSPSPTPVGAATGSTGANPSPAGHRPAPPNGPGRPGGEATPRPPFVPPPSPNEPSSGSRVGVIGLAAVLVVIAVVGMVIIRQGANPQATAPVTTRSPIPTYTSRPGMTGYNSEVAKEFDEGCVNESFNTPGFCRCLYDAISAQIKYDEFVRINQAIDNGARLEDTRVWPLARDCWRKHPPPPG